MINQRIDVLDKGWVELLDMMPHTSSGISPDLAVVNAARVSFLGESKGEEADWKLLRYLMREKHTSPFEMVEFKFRLHAPLVMFWQLVRHRTASMNFSSGRYVEFEAEEFYIPDIWRLQSKMNKQGSDGTLNDLDPVKAQYLTRKLFHKIEEAYADYQLAIEWGVAREQARLFLHGFAVYYTAIWKIDLHNLLHFLRLRMDEHAQYEIRVYAQVIYDSFVKTYAPVTAEAFEEFILNAK